MQAVALFKKIFCSKLFQLLYVRYRGAQYDCNLATTCVFGGKKPMDLCNGGMIWSCCVDRDKVDYVDPNLGAVSDAKCGEVHTRYIHDYAGQAKTCFDLIGKLTIPFLDSFL